MIETHELRKVFKSRRGPVEAVRGVNLSVEQGEIFGFLGPNGAGKTTTLRILATLLDPTSGSAKVAGYDLLKQPKKVRERIGYVSQSGGVEVAATARENLILQGRLYGMHKHDAQQRATLLIKDLELEAFADRPASGYSGGQKRRLDIALGMVHTPALLFLDEPTTGLDPQSRARMWDEVRKMREVGTTVFLTTHYLEEADALCDRLAIIDGGRIVANGTPNELKREIAGDAVVLGLDAHNGARKKAHSLLEQQPFVREVMPIENGLRLYVESGEQALPNILRTLDGAQLALSSISLHRPSLDDVFLHKTGRSLREVEE
ncbi:MAG: ATP-binding cassette domain-containing protein [Chloroflexi bacterium]|uniref:ATP-binding cassette domain-containing protein n=1 Tax=Candidatus Chlorohelix allophototropha TaxID=3003348 RepID=A0A8T7LTU3_9CHLR|nr:ATP-binding cassette domain-containing protein [Chloroflexota bacterium]